MDGNEVRRLVFPRLGGYDTVAVHELLERVAAELDAGRSIAHLIEGATLAGQREKIFGSSGYYDASVDWVLSQLCHQDDPEVRLRTGVRPSLP